MLEIFDVLELIVVDFIAERIVDIIEFWTIDVNVLRRDEFILWVVQYTYLISEISDFILCFTVKNVIEFD
jgi:hypothetical protein